MPVIHLYKALESTTIKYIRWKSHNDWVEHVRIEQRLNQIISCSNDEQNALIIGCIIPSTEIDSNNLAKSQIFASTNNPTTSSQMTESSQQSGLIAEPRESRKQSLQPGQLAAGQQPQHQQTMQPASNTTNAGVVKRRQENNETVFKIYKGVKVFDFSAEKNLLITGGKFFTIIYRMLNTQKSVFLIFIFS